MRIEQRDARALAGTAPAFRRIEVASVIVFPFAALWLALRTRTDLARPTFVLLAIVTGFLLADFISGFFHWFFDTWFSPETPYIGKAFVRTFREHHVDPTAITRHDFVETNGSNILAGGVLVAVGHFFAEAEGAFAPVALLFAGIFMSITSQVHKWAHAERVPRLVSVLQGARLILTKAGHAVHHKAPFDRAYCITSGCLNATLHYVRFFRFLEWLIGATTGVLPRKDDIGEDAAAAIRPQLDVAAKSAEPTDV
ncbi:MAG TPA: fatty acid desaturase family protein [Polyangiaceae bacterium]